MGLDGKTWEPDACGQDGAGSRDPSRISSTESGSLPPCPAVILSVGDESTPNWIPDGLQQGNGAKLFQICVQQTGN